MNINNIKCICLEYNHWIGNNVKKQLNMMKILNLMMTDILELLLAFHDLLKKNLI